jgi:copper resistance protein B
VLKPFALLLLLLAAPAAAEAPTLEADFDLAEYHVEGDDGALIDGGISYGSERDRAVLKLAAGGSVGQRIDEIEAQFLYSRSIGGGVALLAGIRHEFQPHPHVTYGVVGLESEAAPGLALESYMFVSEKGDMLGEVKAIYDQALTSRLTLQPRVAFNLSAQSVPEQGLASGLTDAEFGLRLRYALQPQFAPYIGVSHERLLGETARRARVAGEVLRATHLVIGFSSSF